MNDSAGTEAADLRDRVSELLWYHTLELGPGIETPGWFDTREVAGKVPFPESLAGCRCLDVGTFDGFWAFEMERRGAAEVIGIDILEPDQWDWPQGSEPAVIAEIGRRKAGGKGFEIARDALGSKVERLELSVYDLEPERIGRFDLVYLGSLLMHLRDPVGALEAIRSVCEGTLIVLDNVSGHRFAPRRPIAQLDGRGRPWWWKPSPAALARMVEAAGFRILSGPDPVRMKVGAGGARPPLSARGLLSRAWWVTARDALAGDPHAVLSAAPVNDR